jgi:putative heme iron utilization protein
MSGEVVDEFEHQPDADAVETRLRQEMQADDLEHRATEAAQLASEAIRQEDGEALQGIALCLLAYKRRELDP